MPILMKCYLNELVIKNKVIFKMHNGIKLKFLGEVHFIIIIIFCKKRESQTLQPMPERPSTFKITDTC